jgi:hypothetical protein
LNLQKQLLTKIKKYLNPFDDIPLAVARVSRVTAGKKVLPLNFLNRS